MAAAQGNVVSIPNLFSRRSLCPVCQRLSRLFFPNACFAYQLAPLCHFRSHHGAEFSRRAADGLDARAIESRFDFCIAQAQRDITAEAGDELAGAKTPKGEVDS